MTFWKSRLCVYLAILTFNITASAGQPDWLNHKFTYIADGEPLKKILEEFSVSYGISSVVSDSLDKPIFGEFKAVGPQKLLSTLSQVSDMKWYFDGITMYFYSRDEAERVVINLKHIPVARLKKAILETSAWQQDAQWEVLRNHNVVLVTGAPAFVDLVKSIVKMVDRPDHYRVGDSYAIRIYRLQYASVLDYEYSYRGNVQVVPGVASLLRGWFVGRDDIRAENDISGVADSIVQLRTNEEVSQRRLGPSQSARSFSSRHRAFMEIEPRINAIVIGDTLENHKLYKKMLSNVDLQAPQIQIEVTIAHLHRDALEDLGSFWQVARNGGNEYVRIGQTSTADVSLRPGEFGLMLGKTSSFLTALRHLESNGRGEILSRPVLTTTENYEAVLDSNSTFHIRLEGRNEVDLVPVTVGTLLRVTPRIVDEGDGASVQLNIHIEDGQQSKQLIDDIPAINQIVINTHATIRESQSLLIGGLYYQSDEESTTSVPLMNKVPVLKNLFRARRRDAQSTTRVFLISPKILSNAPALYDVERLRSSVH